MVTAKKELFTQKQQNDFKMLLEHQKASRGVKLKDVLQNLTGTLRHDDVLPVSHMCCDLTWMEIYQSTLHHHEHALYRCAKTI